MTTRTDIARYMIDQIDERQHVYQAEMVDEIELKFGSEWVYENENGNMAISPKVLAEFRKLHGGRIEWDKYDKSWAHI